VQLLSSSPVFYELDDMLSEQEKYPMPFDRNELTFGMVRDVNSKALCLSLAGNALGMRELYENTPASEVFEMHVLRTIEQYNERVLTKRMRR
jgi:hypothetical protein